MILNFLKYLMEKKGSDLHMKIGNKPLIRLNGELMFVEGSELIKPADMDLIEKELLDQKQKEDFYKRKNLDFSYSISGIGRFRMNLFFQRGTVALVARRIEQNIVSIKELGLPEVLKEIILEKRGIILVTGATGNGKSTTISAMLEYVNKTFTKNIITLEDPIEYLFKDKKSIISQREIPNDIEDYNSALKYIIRQDPDIIFIGELRDKETIDAALKAAETGHLVVSTLHTVNATQTINRILDFYSAEQRKQVRYQLSDNLKAVVSQRLIKSKSEKTRVVAVEVMRETPTIKELILSPEGLKAIPEAIKEGSKMYNMKTFDQAIGELYLDNKISYKTALESATLKKEIELLKRGVHYESIVSDYKNYSEAEYYEE